MVYERLPRSTKHSTVGHRNSEERITLISHSVSTAILRACHQVYQEALPLVNKAIREWIQDGGVKVIGTMEFVDLCGLQKLLYALCYISNINVRFTDRFLLILALANNPSFQSHSRCILRKVSTMTQNRMFGRGSIKSDIPQTTMSIAFVLGSQDRP